MLPRRFVLLAATALGVGAHHPARADAADAPALTPADRGLVERMAATLDGITTLKARFLQVDSSNRTSGGTAWLDRPGRMRFEYDKPSGVLLVANGATVIFHDSKVGQTTRIPLDRTPLGILLAPHVTIGGDVAVTSVREANAAAEATLERANAPGDGNLTLVFSLQPFALRSWTVVDAQGNATRVELFDVTLGGSFPPSLFTFTGTDD